MDLLVVVFVLFFVGVAGWMMVNSFQIWMNVRQAQYLVFTLISLAILLTTVASVIWMD